MCIAKRMSKTDSRFGQLLFQATIGGNVGVAILVLVHIAILLRLKPFRKEHRCCAWLVRCVHLLFEVVTVSCEHVRIAGKC